MLDQSRKFKEGFARASGPLRCLTHLLIACRYPTRKSVCKSVSGPCILWGYYTLNCARSATVDFPMVPGSRVRSLVTMRVGFSMKQGHRIVNGKAMISCVIVMSKSKSNANVTRREQLRNITHAKRKCNERYHNGKMGGRMEARKSNHAWLKSAFRRKDKRKEVEPLRIGASSAHRSSRCRSHHQDRSTPPPRHHPGRQATDRE